MNKENDEDEKLRNSHAKNMNSQGRKQHLLLLRLFVPPPNPNQSYIKNPTKHTKFEFSRLLQLLRISRLQF